MPDVVVADTSSLIVLSKIKQIDLLNKIYKRVVTTPEIELEFGDPLPNWIEVIKVKDINFQKALELQIDRGEASAIALSYELSNAILVLDDLKARKVSGLLHLKFTGTLGVLARAKREKFIPSLKPVIDRLLTTTFRVSKDVVDELLRQNGESNS